MKKIILISIFLILALLSGQLLLASMSSPNGYQIWADAISLGGTEDASNTSGFKLIDTIGEAGIGQSSSTAMVVSAGFRNMEAILPVLTLNISPTSLDFGQLDTASTKNVSHALTVESNSATGVQVSVSGNSLTKGTTVISPMGATAGPSNVGTSQFGMKVSHVSGDANAQPTAQYNMGDNFAFNSGDVIINSSIPMSSPASFNVNYMANIGRTQDNGAYTANITYTALANF